MSEFPEQFDIFYRKARSDLSLAMAGFGTHDRNIDQATLIFHLQQATEKSLKALLAFESVHFEKTHDIRILIDLCKKGAVVLPDYVEKLKELNPYAVLGRYDIIDSGEDCFEEYYPLVERLINEVESRLYGKR